MCVRPLCVRVREGVREMCACEVYVRFLPPTHMCGHACPVLGVCGCVGHTTGKGF